MPKTLKGKISLVYVGLVLLIAFVGAVSIVNMLILQKAVNGLMAENYDSISAMEKASDTLHQQNVAILQYLELNDSTAIDRYHQAEQIFEQELWKEKNNITEPGEQKTATALNQDYASWTHAFSLFENVRDMQGRSEAAVYYQNNLEPLSAKIDTELNRIITLNQAAMLQKKSVTVSYARDSLYIILVISVLTVSGGFLLSRYLLGRFLHPLQLFTQSISKIRAGERNTRLDIKTGDEMENLAHEFNEMVERLSTFEKSTLGTLMEEKNRSVAIVKSISDPLIVLDNDYKIVMANSACERFFDFNETKMLGKHFLEAIRDGELFNFIVDGMEQAAVVCQKIWCFQREKAYYFNIILTRGHNGKQQGNGCILLMQNVTDFKELERTKTDFVATVSHEFKTPLTSIIMGASMLEGGHLGLLDEEQANVVKTIIEDGERLSGFVNELLEVSRLESGKAVYSFEPCAICAIVEDSIRQYAEMAAREQVTIENDVDEDMPLICADFERVTWVMNNLLNNALKYTKAGDFITISAKVKGNMLETAVKDTGDGIPVEYLDRIFEKFVQVKGQDIEVRGTGLGLAVAKEIVTAHQGTITVESEMDVGSTFRFTLPLFQKGKGRKIIDDSRTNR